MSGTKIVIIVLVLIALLFIVFVVRGALRRDPPPPKSTELKSSAKKTEQPGWAEGVKDLFSSLKPKIELKQQFYSTDTEETIKPDDKKPFRVATFHWLKGKASIVYDDDTPLSSDNPLKDMDDPQEYELPQTDDEVKDKTRCSILALKRGGKFRFKCLENSACRVEVE